MTTSAVITGVIALAILVAACYASRFLWAATILPLAFLVAAGFHRGGSSCGIAILLGGGFVWASVGYLSLTRHDRGMHRRAAERARVDETLRAAKRREAEARSAEWMAEYVAAEKARLEREESDAQALAEAEAEAAIAREEAVAEQQRQDAIRALLAPRTEDGVERPSPTARQQHPRVSRPSWDLDAILDGIPEPQPVDDQIRSSDG